MARVDDDADARGVEPELGGRDLAEDGMGALAHLGPGVEDGETAVTFGTQDRTAVLGQAVADARVLGAAGDARVARGPVLVAHREQRVLEADAGPQLLPRPEAIALGDGVAPAHLPAVDADRLGEPVEQPLDGEVGLVGTEAAHRAGRRVVRVDRAGLDIDVGHLVGAAGVAGSALQHLAADAGVRAVVADHPSLDGDQVAIRVTGHRVVHPEGMALHREAQALGARQRQHHGPPGHEGEQRGVGLDVEVLLAAEGPTGRDLRDEDVGRIEAEERGDLAAVLPGPLALREHVQPMADARRPVAVASRRPDRRPAARQGMTRAPGRHARWRPW